MTTWYVLVEEDTRETKYAEGTELRLHRWKLVATRGISPTVEEATVEEAAAEEAAAQEAAAEAERLALQHVPAVIARHARPGDQPAREAYLTADGAWVVSVRQRGREAHVRVSVARLMHKQEESEGPPPPSWKHRLRKAF
ncbi:hypothetical protein [Streptomyces sp. XY006]|uniref:hypothetical protein n=1 Tax=Streptomyces sp. XY006 TaxID=2021410 RepID=UPI000B8C09A0|nr:hypothetical protein [Streptomyces sp. XY006]OXS35630.1 hypothetical protein CHR28_09410 [Streptomyces sp. XY006]